VTEAVDPAPRRAWKFLDEIGRGMVSGHTWPVPGPDGLPGAWVEAGGPLEVCARGVHACRIDDLGWWLSAQLWEVELDGEQLADTHAVVAERGRLVRPVDGWPGVGPELAVWAIGRTRDRAVELLGPDEPVSAGALAAAGSVPEMARVVAGLPQDLDRPGPMAVAMLASQLGAATNPVACCAAGAQSAAHLASTIAGPAAARPGFARERVEQGRWLAARLGLEP
jgi:hypothetical protein